MTSTSDTPAGPSAQATRSPFRGLLAATEIDLRLLGMLVALVVIFVGFGILTEGKILRPSSMVVFSIQFAVVAIMATGMVLVIVTRNIDLSVGSTQGLSAMVFALLMTQWLPSLGIGLANPFQWIIALALGLALGAGIGAFQGFIIAYVGVPSFVVTLGGLLAFRGSIWVLSGGAAVTGLDPTFTLLNGDYRGSVGETVTWGLAIIGCLAIVGLLLYNRRQRHRFGFPARPVWADVLLGAIGCGAILLVAVYANANYWPPVPAQRYAEQHGMVIPEGGVQIPVGIPWPILIVIGVTLVMSFVAARRRFGRYVYAYGGNPEAAELAGINTRWTVLKVFTLMGLLCAIAGAISAARINGATLDVGQTNELYVIAAAVVGGTSFAGGTGTIVGAVLGAIVMQALNYGLAYLGVETAVREIVAGAVLVVAVGFDTYNRRRGGR